jgi:hypothetical protein
MRIRVGIAVVSCVMLALGSVFGVSAAGRPPSDIPVTVTLADVGDGGYPLRVQSDDLGAYVHSKTGTAIITFNRAGSDWQITTYYLSKSKYVPSNRTVLFDLSEQVTAGNFPTPIESPTYMPAHLIAKCSQVNVDMLQIPVGQSAFCPGAFRFWAPNGNWYRLSFQPENYPQVDPMRVTCQSSDPAGCKVWTITPGNTVLTGDDPNPKSLHKLLWIDGGGTILDEGGDYYLSFSITVAR